MSRYNKYRTSVRNISDKLRDMPNHREKYICGHIAEVLHGTDIPQVKLSKISAAIEALERVGKE